LSLNRAEVHLPGGDHRFAAVPGLLLAVLFKALRIGPMWATSRIGHSRFARTALAGGVLPVVLALVNQQLAARMVAGYDAGATAFAWAALVAEIALVGWLCANFIMPAATRWVAYVWMWGLVDFVFLPATAHGLWWGHPLALLMAGLLAVQLVLVAIWAVFGGTRWSIRWPAAGALLALGVGIPLAVQAYGPNQVTIVVGSQTGTFLLGCLALRWSGYRLAMLEAASLGDAYDESDVNKRLRVRTAQTQFSVRDMIIWTTLCAAILALARGAGLLSPINLKSLLEHAPMLMWLTGGFSGLVLMATMWAMIARGSAWLRWVGLGVIAVFCGLATAFFYSLAIRAVWTAGPGLPFFSLRFWEYFLTTKWPLLAWNGVSAAMLMSSLVFFRAQGCRLVNQRGET